MNRRPFPDVPGGYPFPRLELDVLEEWKRDRVFERTLEATAGSERHFVFFEGPPTANNVPHVGHVVTRVVKDLFPRYRTMRGDFVARKAGWDTHGLPVEIEVEKRLGFTGKEQIEAYGIARFNRACLESVHTYERQWRAMTERVAYWLDLDRPYLTYTNEYVESLWWALADLWKKGLLVQDYKIQPYCGRCGTTLSSHEVAQNYKDAEDPSIWVGFPARAGQVRTTLDGGTFTFGPHLRFVAWTTTPWTVLVNVALAANPRLVYRVVERPDRPGEQLLIAEGLGTAVPLAAEVDGERRTLDLRELPAIARFRGADLAGLLYDRPFKVGHVDQVLGTARDQGDSPYSDATGWPLVLADYVTASDGTGLVHTAPAFGEDDYASGVAHGLPLTFSVDRQGRVAQRPGLEEFAGVWFKEADPRITARLKADGFLLHAGRTSHSYPFCWRCDRPLLYYANLGWFIRTTARKDALVAKNKEIAWHPPHVGEGRFGNWLENVVDWALSRKRYWGTPLPVWECDRCEHRQVIGSYAELFAAAGRPLPANPYDREQFDPHRPFVDRAPATEDQPEPFVWACTHCVGGTMGRVDDVVDAWFDSGAMPFAQHHYPFENAELVSGRKQFPADFISEAVDQTRGWFYTLHALGVLLFDEVAYRNCIVLGHVNDEQGRKMSKRLGNVVDPMKVIEESGADALRWYFYLNNPEAPSRFSARLVREAAQRFMLPLWNALSFFTIYANLDGWNPPAADSAELDFARRPALDRWILLRLDRLVAEVTADLEAYAVQEPAQRIQGFLDELTNWYIRRSRERFWAPAGADDEAKESAYRALHEVLATLARLLAPFTPFLAETLHRNVVRSQRDGAPVSVHLESWPEPAARPAEPELEAAMATLQRVVSLSHAARNTHALKTRQPLSAVTIVSADAGLPSRLAPYLDLLRDEVNVREVHWAKARTRYVSHAVLPIFPKLGKRLGKAMPRLKAALQEADGDALAAALERDGRITVTVDDVPIELAAEELEVRLLEREGVATQGDRELLVALDTELTPDLVREGLARELVHRVQTARKEMQLDYADRVRVRYRAAPELATAIAEHREWIAHETLAAAIDEVNEAELGLESTMVDGHALALAVERLQDAPVAG